MAGAARCRPFEPARLTSRLRAGSRQQGAAGRGMDVATRRRTGGVRPSAAVLVLLGGLVAGGVAAAPPAQPRLDPLAQSVIDSLAQPPRTAPADLLDAAIMAADVDAQAVSLGYFKKLRGALEDAGDNRADLLADLGDAADPAALLRLERNIGERDPDVRPVIAAIRDAASLRRRDSARLARNVGDLRADSHATRTAAAERLSRAGIAALPALVDLLQTDDPAGERPRAIARELIRNTGADGHRALLDWLGSDDVPHWPGVIEALDAIDEEDDEVFLLAPAAVPGTPPAARDRAIAALRRRAAARAASAKPDTGARAGMPPAPSVAAALVAERLDRVLSRDVDDLVPDHCRPIVDGRPEPPRTARAREAMHLARDLMALGARDPAAVRLVLLSRLEAALADPQTPAVDRIEPGKLQAALSGPDGFDAGTVAEVLDMAAVRCMPAAAAAAARSLSVAQPAPNGAAPNGAVPAGKEPPPPLQPAVRRSLVRLLAAPDPAAQFEAARTLALAAGDPPYPGSSRVVETLLHAATSTGIDRVVVAHPEAAVVQSMAAEASRLGFQTVRVSTGRDAVFAVRESCDTVLVLLSARIVRPTVYETVQFLQQPATGDVPPVLVVVDPLDDDGRGKFLTRLLMKFADVQGVAIVDRLDSFFRPAVDATTGDVLAPPRFPDVLAELAGPGAADPAVRGPRAAVRLARARESLDLLAGLGARGWDVSAIVSTATLALDHDELREPALAALAAVGSSRAQQAILRQTDRGDRSADDHRAAAAAFQASVERHGILLESHGLLAAYARYNRAGDADSRELAGQILDVIETPSTKSNQLLGDAAQPRPTR